MNTHEFEEKKLAKQGKCGDCHTKLSSGLLAAKAFQCRNCLAILCKKCRHKPENAAGCGTGMSSNAQQPAAAQSDPVMEFYIKYVKRNANGEMVVRGLPPEWKQLFKDAGVKPKELQDPKTASWLIGLMNDILSGAVGNVSDTGASSDAGATAAAADDVSVLRVEALYDFNAVQEGDLNFSKGSIIVVRNVLDNGWAEGECNGAFGQFPYNYVKELPPEPKAPPPAPIPARPAPAAPAAPTNMAPAAPVAAAVADAPISANAPAPPPPPPPAPVGGGPKAPPPPPAAAPAAATGGPAGAPPPPAVSAKPSPGKSLLDDIAAGKQLRKVADTPAPAQKKELSQLTAGERSNMLDIISAAMNARRKDIDDNNDDGDGDWDDWEDD
jgi:hypothetical protein